MDARWSDAWFLLAVDWANQGENPGIVGGSHGDLSDVIGAADAINHSMLLREEIEHAVRLLVPAGLLRIVDDRFEVTVQGRAMCERAQGEDVVETMRTILLLLEGSPEPTGEPMYWILDPLVEREAEDRYRARFRKELKKLQATQEPPATPPGLILP